MKAHRLLSGEIIRYSPPPQVDEYITMLKIAANDPTVTVGDFVDLIYGEENPLLKKGIIPGRGVVTREIFENPAYHVMTDLLEQKRIQTGHLDREAAESMHTMTVPEAAERLGISESAVRQAIYAKRLAARKVKGSWLLYPAGVDAYKVSNRGPNAERPLSMATGAVKGLSCRIKLPKPLEGAHKASQGVRHGTLRRWRRIGVLIGGSSVEKVPGRKGYTFWELAPGDKEDQIEIGPFFVRGPFQIIRTVEHSREALDEYKKFEAR